jgi:hypothetical protein
MKHLSVNDRRCRGFKRREAGGKEVLPHLVEIVRILAIFDGPARLMARLARPIHQWETLTPM